VFAIRDCGAGFAWERFLSLDETRAFHPNGRGIALARNIAFRTLEYRGCGNEVVVSALVRRPGPAGVQARSKAAEGS
jgi:hypothetical protein